MSQDITGTTPLSAVISHLQGFITEDADGSQRLNTAAMQRWLSEQFGYSSLSATSRSAKDAQAAAIANALQSVVNRENWASNPAYPQPAAGASESARDRLIELRTKMYREVKTMTDLYRPFDAGLASRIKSMFNTMVLPSFPAGVPREEVTRAYIETFVTDWGEESAPSPASDLVTMDGNDSATVQCNDPPAGRNITMRRLYRSTTGTTQSAWKLQGEYPIVQKFITDNKLDKELNEPCATFGWLQPPANLANLCGMDNGIMLGSVGRTLYACEPYAPYAYPAKYDKPLPHEIVGIVSMGQAAFIGTVQYPYVVSGSDSASLTEERIKDLVPCASARSMVAISGSVFYASQDGLALYENGRVTIVSEGMDRKTWQAYNPSSMRAAGYDGRYVVFYTKTDNTKGGLIFDYKSKTISEITQAADAVLASHDGLYILNGTGLLNLLPSSGAKRTGLWASKTFRLAKQDHFFWLQVDGEFDAGSVTLRVYGDGELHHTAVITNGRPVRCKAGRRTSWRIEVESASKVNGVALASSTQELKGIR